MGSWQLPPRRSWPVQFWACLWAPHRGVSPPQAPEADALQRSLRLCGAEKRHQQPPRAPGQMASSRQDVPGGTHGRFANPLWFVGHQLREGKAWPAAAGLQAGGICSEALALMLHPPRMKRPGTGSALRGPQEAGVPVSVCPGGKRCQDPKVFAFASVLRRSVLRALFCVLWEPTICKDMLLG